MHGVYIEKEKEDKGLGFDVVICFLFCGHTSVGRLTYAFVLSTCIVIVTNTAIKKRLLSGNIVH